MIANIFRIEEIALGRISYNAVARFRSEHGGASRMERMGGIVISDETDMSVAQMWAIQRKGLASLNIPEE